MSNVPSLKQRVLDAERSAAHLSSLLDSFFTGDVPDTGASLTHMLLAKWGRKRLEELRQQPALLRAEQP